MNLKNTSKIAMLLGSAVLFGEAYAQDLSSTRKAPLDNLLENVYSNAKISHHTKRKVRPEDSHVRVDAEYTLGTKLFDKKLDLYGTVGVKHQPGTSHVSQKSSKIQADVYAYQSDILKFMPYLVFDLPYENSHGVDKGVNGRLGFEFEPKYAASTGAGVLGVAAGYDGAVLINSRPVNVPAYYKDGAVSEKKGEAGAPGLRRLASAKLFYIPGFVQGLYAEYKFAHLVSGSPRLLDDEGELRQEHGKFGPEYNYRDGSSHRLRLKYDVTREVYLQNDLTVFSKQPGDPRVRYENVFAITASLM